MRYKLSNRSRDNLRDVHPDLVAVVLLALYCNTTVDFSVIEGVRSIERQKALVADGKSKTMNSRHLIQKDGFAHAVDLAPWIMGTIPWDDAGAFRAVSKAMKKAAETLGVSIEWGGDWRTFVDMPHYQLGGN